MPRREPLLLPGEAAEGCAHRLTKDERLKEEDGGARGGSVLAEVLHWHRQEGTGVQGGSSGVLVTVGHMGHDEAGERDSHCVEKARKSLSL